MQPQPTLVRPGNTQPWTALYFNLRFPILTGPADHGYCYFNDNHDPYPVVGPGVNSFPTWFIWPPQNFNTMAFVIKNIFSSGAGGNGQITNIGYNNTGIFFDLYTVDKNGATIEHIIDSDYSNASAQSNLMTGNLGGGGQDSLAGNIHGNYYWITQIPRSFKYICGFQAETRIKVAPASITLRSSIPLFIVSMT